MMRFILKDLRKNIKKKMKFTTRNLTKNIQGMKYITRNLIKLKKKQFIIKALTTPITTSPENSQEM